MKCILLCAGYVEGYEKSGIPIPRSLLNITDKQTILDYSIDKIMDISIIDEIIIVTNSRYEKVLREWLMARSFVKKIKIINDTTNNENEMLGAIGDILYVINYENINDDLLVVFGDNLFDFSLEKFAKICMEKNQIIIGGSEEDDITVLSRLGVIEMNENQIVTDFEEKPLYPKGNIKSYGIYAFPRRVLPYFEMYLEEGNKAETPGYFIKYLYKQEPIYVHCCKGNWFDIQTKDDLEKARKIIL